MRNYLREAIRQEVRQELREEAERSGATPASAGAVSPSPGANGAGPDGTRTGGLALLLEESYQRTVLPLGRRGRARSSLEGSFAHQVQQAEQEPGVRRQL